LSELSAPLQIRASRSHGNLAASGGNRLKPWNAVTLCATRGRKTPG
jgi:hypothetical protein